jgi:ribosomal protein L40E
MHSQTSTTHKMVCTYGHECSFTQQPGSEQCRKCMLFRLDAKKPQPIFDSDYGLEVGRAIISEYSRPV